MTQAIATDFNKPESVVDAFIAAMHQWELDAAREMQIASETDEPSAYQAVILQTHAALFLRYCTVRDRKYGRLGSFSMPPEYDPTKEKILSSTIDAKKKTATVETLRDAMWGSPEKYRYILFLTDGKWLIDNQKLERNDKWIQNIL